MSAKLASSLPTDDRNGLANIARDFVQDHDSTHVIVAVVDCKQITTDVDSGAEIPTMRVRAIEGFRGDSADGIDVPDDQ